jgi:hypothetical protein
VSGLGTPRSKEGPRLAPPLVGPLLVSYSGFLGSPYVCDRVYPSHYTICWVATPMWSTIQDDVREIVWLVTVVGGVLLSVGATIALAKAVVGFI